MGKIRSYTSGDTSGSAFLRELGSLYRYSQQASERARESIEDVRLREAIVNRHLGFELRGLDILEIGPGQLQAHMKYLSVKNRVVGIDLDVITQSLSPLDYLRMLRTNGLRRAAKTLGRKLLGVDRKFASELRRQIGVARLQVPKVIQMDAAQMSFADESFDFVYARSVFHHLPDPGAVLDGIVRVLRPGGAAYILLHLYASQTGCLDPRVYTNRRREVQGWPHLRPELRATLDGRGTYVNKLRLHEWQALFNSKMPEAKHLITKAGDEALELARTLHNQGILVDYSLNELTTHDLAVLWQKPYPCAPSTEAQENTKPESGF